MSLFLKSFIVGSGELCFIVEIKPQLHVSLLEIILYISCQLKREKKNKKPGYIGAIHLQDGTKVQHKSGNLGVWGFCLWLRFRKTVGY